jgi:hypothetical protein
MNLPGTTTPPAAVAAAKAGSGVKWLQLVQGLAMAANVANAQRPAPPSGGGGGQIGRPNQMSPDDRERMLRRYIAVNPNLPQMPRY